jgi:hypothetical protein
MTQPDELVELRPNRNDGHPITSGRRFTAFPSIEGRVDIDEQTWHRIVACETANGIDNAIGPGIVTPKWKNDEPSRQVGSAAFIIRTQQGPGFDNLEPNSLGLYTVNGLSFQSDGIRVWVDGKRGRVELHDSSNEAPIMWGTEGPWTFAQAVLHRNKLRRRERHTVLPTNLSTMMKSTHTREGTRSRTVPSWEPVWGTRTEGTMSDKRRTTTVSVRLSSATNERLHADGRQLRLFHHFESGRPEELAEMVMSTLQYMTPECALCAMGVASKLFETGNRPTALTVAGLANLRGIPNERLGAKDKRRLGAFIDLLCNWELIIDDANGKELRGKLFQVQWEATSNGTRSGVLLNLNAYVFNELKERGHGYVIPRQLLHVSVKDEWVPKVGSYLADRFNLNYRDRAKGKDHRESCQSILQRSGVDVDIDENRRKEGLNATGSIRARMTRTLDALVPTGVLESWRVERKDNPADDVYQLVPGREFTQAVVDRRQPALTAKPKRRKRATTTLSDTSDKASQGATG